MLSRTFLLLFINLYRAEAEYFGNRENLFTKLTVEYNLPVNEAAIWTCIAEHSSGFENSGSNAVYGIFQISEIWCSGAQASCPSSCSNLTDNSFTDDIECVRKIRSIQGLNAWDAWTSKCEGKLSEYGADSKFEKRCGFARKLYFEQGISYGQLPYWTCIAEETSGFDFKKTGDSYGVFQISSKLWCAEDPLQAANSRCKIPCHFLLDNQLADDVKCAILIYNTTAQHADGFSAWGVQGKCFSYRSKLEGCFEDDNYSQKLTLPAKSRAFTPCELAKELSVVHKIAKHDVAPYVCIAYHSSRLITDSDLFGAGHHGLWQVGDVWWCGEGKGCGVSCEELTKTNIEESVKCAKRVKADNGFNGWDVYKAYCSKSTQRALLRGCLEYTEFRPKPCWKKNDVISDLRDWSEEECNDLE